MIKKFLLQRRVIQMSNKTIKPVSIVLGAIFATTLAASNIANASEAGANPFAMTNIDGGYQVAKDGKCGANMKKKDGKCGAKKAAKKKDGKCGEGKCGGKKAMKKKDAKCGDGMAKSKKKDGKCGADHKKMSEGKCGGKK